MKEQKGVQQRAKISKRVKHVFGWSLGKDCRGWVFGGLPYHCSYDKKLRDRKNCVKNHQEAWSSLSRFLVTNAGHTTYKVLLAAIVSP